MYVLILGSEKLNLPLDLQNDMELSDWNSLSLNMYVKKEFAAW